MAILNFVALFVFSIFAGPDLTMKFFLAAILILELGLGLVLRRGKNRRIGNILLFGIGFTVGAVALILILVGTCFHVFF